MKKPSVSPSKFFVVFLLCLFVFGGVPVEFAEEKTFFHGYVIPKPVIRVGLGVNLSNINVSASSGVKIYEVKDNYKLIAEDVDEVWIRGHKEKLNERFLVQVAQSDDSEEAELFASDLREKIENKVTVIRNTEEGVQDSYQVRVGHFMTRQDALTFIKELQQLGIENTWILREEITKEESRPFWILVNNELKGLNNDTDLYFIPSHARSYLSFKGRDYRGIFVLKASRKGMVLINIINLDDYLKGVVPSELSPYLYRELEAQKAQAVAARTYASKKMGSYKDLGFDLDDTPNSQFYRGMNAEHPLSSQAVDLTQGEVVLYKGKLIDALYTSTCGGMTENVEDVFNGPALPYLRSTECVYDKQKGYVLRSNRSVVPVYLDGKNISPSIAYLSSLGIFPFESDPLFFKEEISFQEAASWIESASKISGKTFQFEPRVEPSIDHRTLARLFVDAFEWQEEVDHLLFPSEKSFVLRNLQGGDGDKSDEVAYLIFAGIFPSPDVAQQTGRSISRGDLVLYLNRSLLNQKDLAGMGKFKSLEKDRVTVVAGREEKQFNILPETYLLLNSNGDFHFVKEANLLGGEDIRWIERDGQALFIEVKNPPQTNVLDRSSIYSSWESRKSKEDLESRINRYYPIGELIDLIPQRRGESNRLAQLQISGSESQAVADGFRIRTVLGLRETLFVIEREYDESGNITHFVFNGRGWGHGVGLCQVGAFGMAQVGAGYKEILKKYYHGITIGKIY